MKPSIDIIIVINRVLRTTNVVLPIFRTSPRSPVHRLDKAPNPAIPAIPHR